MSHSLYNKETSSSPEKGSARELNVQIYKELTGFSYIPKNKQYWTLCHQVAFVPHNELSQLISLDFLNETQFFGINRDEKIIHENKNFYSKSNWFCGDWIKVITKEFDLDLFNPACIYLDTTGLAGSLKNVLLIRDTMRLCPVKTVLFVNLMLNNPMDGRIYDHNFLISELPKYLLRKELKKWNSKVENFVYNATGKTTMITYSFFKKG